MLPYDTDFVLLAHADRTEALRRSARAAAGHPSRHRVRRRLGGWLISTGVRLAAETPPRTSPPPLRRTPRVRAF